MKLLAAAALVALSAAAPAAPDKPKLDITNFFTGKTRADNVMKVAFHGPKKLVVDSVGGRNKEGQFVLIDTVREEGKPERKRTWVMHPVGPDHYSGVLSDAVGPVDIVVSGPSATIRYTMKDRNLKIVQQLQLQGDGKSVANHVVAKRFGLTFAKVDGTIRKLD